MVNLIEDHQGAAGLGQLSVKCGPARHLGVGHRDAMKVTAVATMTVLERRVEPNASSGCGIRPLAFQMLGWGNNGDAVDESARTKLSGNSEGKGGLACAGCRGRQKIAGLVHKVGLNGLCLPGTQLAGRAPGCALREGRGKVFGCARSLCWAESRWSIHF